MAPLVVETLDYSPLYNATNLRRGATTAGIRVEELALRKEERNLETFRELTQIGLDVADVVFNVVSETQLAKAKLQAQKDDLDIQKLARDAVLNDEVTWEQLPSLTTPNTEAEMAAGMGVMSPSGKQTIKMPKSLEDYFQRRGEEIDKEYGGFPKIKAWARDKLYSSYDIAQKGVMSNAYDKAIRDKATLEGKLIEGALALSTREGAYDYVDAAISASSSLTPAGKEILRLEAHKQVDFGQADKAVRAAAAGQGYDAGIAVVAQLESTGKVTPEQARALEAVALSAAKTAEGVDLQQAETALQSALSTGEDPAKAVDRIVAQTPEHNRSGVKRLLDATVVQIKREVNDKADAELKDFYDKNPDNAVGLDLMLHNPSAKYADRMDTSTYMFWERLAERGTAPDKKPETPAPLKTAMFDVIKDNQRYPTTRAKEAGIREIVRDNPLVTEDSAREYLSMAGDKKWLEGAVNESLVNIGAVYKVREAQALKEDKTGAKLRDVQLQQEATIKEFTKWLGTGVYKDEEIVSKASRILSGAKSQIFKADEFSIYRARTPIDSRRLQATGAEIGEIGAAPLTTEEANQIEQGDRSILEREYGIKAEQFVDAQRMNNGLTWFAVRGLDPERPQAIFRLTFATDDKLNEKLMVWDRKINAKGEEIGGEWRDASSLPTVRDVEKKRLEAETSAKAATETARREKLKKTVQETTPTATAITALAESTKGTTVQEIAGIATAGAEEPSAIQVDQIVSAFTLASKKGKIPLTVIQKLAKDTGVSEAMVLRMAVDRGWQVVK
jgi:hypothetical protein